MILWEESLINRLMKTSKTTLRCVFMIQREQEPRDRDPQPNPKPWCQVCWTLGAIHPVFQRIVRPGLPVVSLSHNSSHSGLRQRPPVVDEQETPHGSPEKSHSRWAAWAGRWTAVPLCHELLLIDGERSLDSYIQGLANSLIFIVNACLLLFLLCSYLIFSTYIMNNEHR